MKKMKLHPLLVFGQIAAVTILLPMILLPLLMVLLRSFQTDGIWRWRAPLETLLDPGLVEVYLNSLKLGLWVVAGATLLAFPMAMIMVKTPLRKHRWMEIVLLVPFMTPPYIGSMGWILFMQPRGFLDQFFPALNFLQPLFFSVFGIVLIMSLHLFPFLYLLLRNALTEISGSLEDAGAIHGGSFSYRLRRIILPLLASPYSMGALLIFVKTISEFGTPATLGRRVGYYVLTTEIYRYTNSWPIDFGKGAAIASLLLGTSLLIWAVQTVLSSRYAVQIVSGRNRDARVYLTGFRQWPAWLFIFSALTLSVGVPYFSIVATSLMNLRGYGLQLNNLTVSHYQAILTWGSSGLEAMLTSFRLSAISATLSLVIGTFIALVVVPSRGFRKGFIDASSILSNTVPSIVIIVGMILFWNSPWMPLTIYNTNAMLVLTYTVLFLPFTVQYVKSSREQIDATLFQAARVSGARPFYLFRQILFPLIRPGMVAGWLMTFIISVRELIASLMVRPPGLQTTATFIFREFEQGNASLGMAMAVLTVGLTLLVMTLVQMIQRKV
ncbi:ABC transporter permease [Anoxynatronum buryatiense]|uniref:Iron(III) transport system permease protein n=1 Tax=Anoxynatronum buryatiense TaxID=489973 RepID=A0AA45WVZ9_9CLOT|nr:iron ABC transporter permease [Anoxynatronum buryatiense]SMP55394.1 iron(III) transport system permease protein [Anoxynatronum buryatiense]